MDNKRISRKEYKNNLFQKRKPKNIFLRYLLIGFDAILEALGIGEEDK